MQPQKASSKMMMQEALAVIIMFADFEYFMQTFSLGIGIAGFWNGIPSLFRYRPALEYRPVTDFYGIPAEGYTPPS